MFGLVFILIFLFFFIASIYMAFSSKFYSFCKNNSKNVKGNFEIVLTSLNESEDLVIKTIKSWKGLGKRIILLRDGNITKPLKRFCDDNEVILVKRETNKDGKAGALNNYLENYAKEEWFFLVDVDEELKDRKNLYNLFNIKGDIKVSKKEFLPTNFIGHIMNLTNSLFSVPQRFYSRYSKSLFNGSCSFIRTEVAKKLKFKNFRIEDIEFSLRAISNNYSIRYCDCIVAIGKQPSFPSFFIQHMRYIYGVGEILKNYFLNKEYKVGIYLLLFLPLFSLFQTSLILYSFLFLDFLPMFIEFILSYVIFFLYLNEKNPLKYTGVFLLNMIILPIPRVYYFILGALTHSKKFPTTL